jgi:signal transduction histidine kinase
MRASLRQKILFLALFTPATLGVATLLTVSRNVNLHVQSSSVHESLEHTEAVFENMMRARSRALVRDGRVIARDPRFFSLLMLARDQRDAHFDVTVRGMAKDFNRIVQTPIFEIYDRRGKLFVWAGDAKSGLAFNDEPMRAALQGHTPQVVIAPGNVPYQAALVPVMGNGQVVGVLVLGDAIGAPLARDLRSQMRCEVTFISGSTVTGSSLESPGDRGALMMAVRGWRRNPLIDITTMSVQKVQASHNVYLTLVRRIPLSDPKDQQLYVIQRAFDAETAFLQAMEKDMVILALIALLAALVTGLLFSGQILKPIHNLVRGAREMEKGNYDHPLHIKRGDELGYLAERFVEMRQRERTYLGSLEQATRLKSHFLSIASHELRTPISVLIGYRDLLAGGQLGPINDQQKDVLETMQRHLERLTRLAEDAAQFARVKSERVVPSFDTLDIVALLRRALALAQTAGVTRQVELTLDADPGLTTIEVDGAGLERALVQLITNGIRFTADGGKVRIQAKEHGDRLCIKIEDTGIGIDPERLTAMLAGEFAVPEPGNYRSPTGLEFNAAGLGLGLPIARSIIEAHGGTITAHSIRGSGSTFVVEIPLSQSEEESAAA